MKKILMLLCLILVPAMAYAERAPLSNVKHYCATTSSPCGNYNLLDGTSATASAANRTVTKEIDGYTKVAMIVKLTRAAGTAVTVTCTRSMDGGTIYGKTTTRSITSGASALYPLVDTYTTSSTDTINVDYDVFGYTHLSCLYAVTSGSGTDYITVQWTATVGG